MDYSNTTNTSALNLTAKSRGEVPVKAETYIVPIIFAFIFIVGVVGNGTLIFTVLRNKNMRNIPNLFLVSLALGDLLLILVSVPVTATFYIHDEWTFGSAMCKINESLQSLSLGISVFTLVALSGDRYVAIGHPMSRYRGSTMLRTTVIAGLIWILSALLCSLEAVASHTIMYSTEFKIYFCNTYPASWGAWYPKFHVMFRFSIYFAFPMLIIASFYISMARILFISEKRMPGEAPRYGGLRMAATKQTEARKKVARLVLSFVVVFVACWLPRHIYLLWFHFSGDAVNYTMSWHVFKIIGFCLSFTNSCVNPLALYFLSHQFRRYYNRYIFCCCRHARSYYNGTEYSEGTKMFNMQARNSTAIATETETNFTQVGQVNQPYIKDVSM